MEITISFAQDIPIFHLAGRLDALTSPQLEDRLAPLLAQANQRLIFDCESLSYVSSAGLRVFIATLRSLSNTQGRLAIASLTPPVKELFSLAGLENLFCIEATREAAVASILTEE